MPQDDYDRYGAEAAALLRQKDRESRQAMSRRDRDEQFAAQGWAEKIEAARRAGDREAAEKVIREFNEARAEHHLGPDGVAALKGAGVFQDGRILRD